MLRREGSKFNNDAVNLVNPAPNFAPQGQLDMCRVGCRGSRIFANFVNVPAERDGILSMQGVPNTPQINAKASLGEAPAKGGARCSISTATTPKDHVSTGNEYLPRVKYTSGAR